MQQAWVIAFSLFAGCQRRDQDVRRIGLPVRTHSVRDIDEANAGRTNPVGEWGEEIVEEKSLAGIGAGSIIHHLSLCRTLPSISPTSTKLSCTRNVWETRASNIRRNSILMYFGRDHRRRFRVSNGFERQEENSFVCLLSQSKLYVLVYHGVC